MTRNNPIHAIHTILSRFHSDVTTPTTNSNHCSERATAIVVVVSVLIITVTVVAEQQLDVTDLVEESRKAALELLWLQLELSLTLQRGRVIYTMWFQTGIQLNKTLSDRFRHRGNVAGCRVATSFLLVFSFVG